MSYDPQNLAPPGAKIKVIGVGGGGGNAINTMIRSGLEGVDFVSCNTDVQALRFSLAPSRIQVGKELTRGLGAGADPDVGRDAALEDRHEIQELLTGADMVFITAGMGGGTGTGGASVVAQIARELGALTVAVVTKPFQFEGNRRRRHAEAGVARLRECVDTLITIPNQRLLQVAAPGLSMLDAFKMADEVLVNAVRGISDIINIPGTVNVDFADVKTIMSCMGHALMGIGHATGEGRAIEAARMAISSPLLEDIDIEGATGILINITAGSNVTLMEVNEACSIIQEAAHEDANIIFGSVTDDSLGDQIRVTVIATGFPVDEERRSETASGSGKTQPLIQPFASRLTTPGLVTSAAARAAHRPTSQHLTSYTPKRPETTKPVGSDAYAFQGNSAQAAPAPMATQPAAAQPAVTAMPTPSETAAARQEPQFFAEPATTQHSMPEPKPFFNHAADLAPAAPVFEPQAVQAIHVESEAQDLTRLTMSGTIQETATQEGYDEQTAEEAASESIESLANPFLGGFEIAANETEEEMTFDESFDTSFGDDSFGESLGNLGNLDNSGDLGDGQDDILMTAAPQEEEAPAPTKMIIQPNEAEVIVKPSRPAVSEATEIRLEGARAIVDPTDDFVATRPIPASTHTASHEAPVADSLFDDVDDFLTNPAQAGGKNAGEQDLDGASAPLDSFFSNETAAIAGDIDRKINEALELAERMKNPTDNNGSSKSTSSDDLDVPAFLRNGLKDLPLG